ncbi:hypothetical protein [Moorena producens]|nr:hypothetical protein [Moorena producens]NER92164.1 hypothetical protein [Moorena sp. SIO3A2]
MVHYGAGCPNYCVLRLVSCVLRLACSLFPVPCSLLPTPYSLKIYNNR